MNAAATNLNVVDLLMAVLIALMVTTGWRSGIIAEFVKLFGVFCTTFMTLHYYARLANFLSVQFFGRNISTEFFAFFIIAVVFSVSFLLISRGWDLILKVKAKPAIDHYGGLLISLIQSYFACGLLFFALLLLQHGYATPMARQSVSSVIFGQVAPEFYQASYAKIVQRFFPNEKFNEEAVKLVAGEAGVRRK